MATIPTTDDAIVLATHRNGIACLIFYGMDKMGRKYEETIPLRFIMNYSKYALNALTRDTAK